MRRKMKNAGMCLLIVGAAASCTRPALTEQNSASGTALSAGSTTQTNAVAQPNVYTEQCTNAQTITVGASYKLNNNIWGAGTDGAGSQCVWYNSAGMGTWGVNASHTSGTGQNIKGYPALVRGWLWYNSSGSIWASSADTSFPVQMSHLSSCVSNWNVTVPTNGEKYDTAYDIWLDTSNNPNYKAQYEVMVWINYQGPAYNGTDFSPIGTKVGSNITVAGNVWNIWKGYNGTNNVYTFRRATNTSSVTNLDIKALLVYAQNQGFIQSSYYLLGIQAGWEIVAGGAFTTSSYTTTIVKN
jgi:xyloglucan-specific endo-beta-1,4-glucanase